MESRNVGDRNMKRFSSVQEQRIADYLGWKVVSGSGARDFNKGDVESPYFLGECKTHTTKPKKIIFYESHWKKIIEEASSTFKSPVLFVDDGSQSPERTWCMFFVPADFSWQGYDLLKVCPFKTNIIFENSTMKKFLTELNGNKPYYKKQYLRAEFGGRLVGILDLETFAEFFD